MPPSPQRPARLQRSVLAVPATSPRFFAKAAASAADAVFLDLEDAVAPSHKDGAREAAVTALAELDWGEKVMSVRVNGMDTPWAHRDIAAVAAVPRLDMVLLPKAGSASDVAFVDQLLTFIERETGRADPIGIEVLIETARGVANAEEIAGASPRLEAMVFGVGDYTIDMRVPNRVFGRPDPAYAVLTGAPGGARERVAGDQWHFAMARIANACRANGLRPIDGPYTDFGDPEGFSAVAARAQALGFEGKWAIHPSQVDDANAAFSPPPDLVDWARATRDAMTRATGAGAGATQADGVLLDMAHLKMVEHILARADAIAATERARQPA
ncbi:HpcH/HpaI aldolase/citrate lyase family protein [Acuticoccus sp.]|uniref:HpcH/HpaI aldolase/citrate lyase family protein n=1 Tax=Acuticoccus sp. TaxID=1904378 RepID=UPI003B5213FB